ncbi:NADH-ubiquinone oxidoreductase-F iron-sulfur binding region domain-containing protein [Cryobacterium sp. PH29-G1]|uniref:NADH-ubiquinone oxidoreductase-F iron-sulfur binding region domain-containing protein n=1 Tax=Cryobacterium sp. PH29-G1 TaxID=3046211 RepID=UPI0024B926CE|nr:NADH-ubiquinone oxidoreductase-F iron-sulfur binding region domain-containing protein [Cryobacterium sp. PH29-G1]MDJ0349364.1 NADH-ubiquinone oxidoreductase-F iron-sulfur binding region domain-containing protein [Cryobacterium sp. PH29-G1]
MTVVSDRPQAMLAPVGISRLTLAPSPRYASHLATFGPYPTRVNDLLGELTAYGLTGRGGAAFPVWRKIIALPAPERARNRRVSVVGNAAEGEPLSSKDATLLRIAPHLVLDGLLLVAAQMSAARVVLYAPAAVLASASRAISERSDASGIDLREASDRFISGEASAVVNALADGPAVPQDRTLRLTTVGLGGAPTLVHNVETLAHIALIARFGAVWFRSRGSASDAGTRLVTVSDALSFVGPAPSGRVLEIAGGTRIDEVLRFAGINPATLSAVLVGGFHGTWLPANAFNTGLDRDDLARFGATPGAGILLALESGRCPLQTASSIAAFLAHKTAGQCGPCVNGLPAMARVLGRLAAGERSPALPLEVARLAGLVAGRGSCHHPDGTVRFVLSSLSVFQADVAAHLEGRCARSHA